MFKSTAVSHIMSKKVVVANLNNKFTQVRKLFLEFKLKHLLITEDNDKVIGIISTHDVLRAYKELTDRIKVVDDKVLDHEIKLSDIMTPNPETINPDDTVEFAAKKFSQNKYHALPVTEDGIVRGIVTTNDLIKFILD